MKISREWATPLTIGIFALMAVTGLLMFFHRLWFRAEVRGLENVPAGLRHRRSKRRWIAGLSQ